MPAEYWCPYGTYIYSKPCYDPCLFLAPCGDYNDHCDTNWPKFTCNDEATMDYVREDCPKMCGLCSKNGLIIYLF